MFRSSQQYEILVTVTRYTRYYSLEFSRFTVIIADNLKNDCENYVVMRSLFMQNCFIRV